MDQAKLEDYLGQVEERITAHMKTMVRQKDLIAKLKTSGACSAQAERLLAAHHKEGLWLLTQRERIRQQIAQLSAPPSN